MITVLDNPYRPDGSRGLEVPCSTVIREQMRKPTEGLTPAFPTSKNPQSDVIQYLKDTTPEPGLSGGRAIGNRLSERQMEETHKMAIGESNDVNNHGMGDTPMND